ISLSAPRSNITSMVVLRAANQVAGRNVRITGSSLYSLLITTHMSKPSLRMRVGSTVRIRSSSSSSMTLACSRWVRITGYCANVVVTSEISRKLNSILIGSYCVSGLNLQSKICNLKLQDASFILQYFFCALYRNVRLGIVHLFAYGIFYFFHAHGFNESLNIFPVFKNQFGHRGGFVVVILGNHGKER